MNTSIKFAWTIAAAILAFSYAQARDVQVRNFEHVTIRTDANRTQMQKASIGTRAMSFEAFGRHFDLDLISNANALSLELAQGAREVLRGKVRGVEGSWVRLTVKHERVNGMVFDGEQIIVVEHDRDSNSTIAYRADDLLASTDVHIDEGSSRPLDNQYQAVVREVSKGRDVAQQKAGALKSIKVNVLADGHLRAMYASEDEAIDAVVTRMNNVDGIFSAQLGLEIQLTGVEFVGDELKATTNASELLKDLRTVRYYNNHHNVSGITHLMTGRKLDGTTVGIAYHASLCMSLDGVSLAAHSNRASYDSLISVHELGHNLGAGHDGVEECASVTQNTFLMSPTLSEARTKLEFSQCSLQHMQAVVEESFCVSGRTPDPEADLGVSVSMPAVYQQGSTITASVTARSFSDIRVDTGVMTLSLSNGGQFTSANVDGKACQNTGTTATCYLGSIEAGAEKIGTVVVSTDLTDSISLNATIESNHGDPNAENNSTTQISNKASRGPVAGATPSSGGGGGGSTSWSFVLGLALLSVARRAQVVAGFRSHHE